MAAYDDLNGKRITTISVISIAVTAVTVLAVQVIYFAMANYIESKKIAEAVYTRSNASLEQQFEEVESYGVDPDNGNVTIPVSEAMKKMAANASNEST